MTPVEFASQVEGIRRFSRFYTRKLGILQQGAYHSPFSLAEVRVLYELAHRDETTASVLRAELGLDAGYLSRMLGGFKKRGYLQKKASRDDRRQSLLSLSAAGRKAFAPLDRRSAAEVGAMLEPLSAGERKQVAAAMETLELLLGPREKDGREPYVLRPHQPGDMGWVVHRHGALYWQEYRYDEQFEAVVAEIVADFLRHFDARRERCWIAERKGEIAGSIFLVKKSKTEAKLRLLLVEPSARGLGIGRRLVSECVRFARQTGYRKITLWTQDDLYAARHLYREAGFRVVHKEPHHSFGRDLVAETWELDLTKARHGD